MESQQAERLEARRILGEITRAIDRRLSIEVRDIPGQQERLQVTVTHGQHHGQHGQLELSLPEILATTGDPTARNQLRLRLKRTADTMLFRKMPDHRVKVKPIAPPGGQLGPRGPARGRR
ncbi:MAG: hypothetical protein U0807_18735 [Candidatus Binatia bacterium]